MKALESGTAGHYTWVAATVYSNSAAGYQLGSGDPVMAIGGFNGTDPAPTLAQSEHYVADKKIHYFISVRGGGSRQTGAPRAPAAGQITQWVETHFAAGDTRTASRSTTCRAPSEVRCVALHDVPPKRIGMPALLRRGRLRVPIH